MFADQRGAQLQQYWRAGQQPRRSVHGGREFADQRRGRYVFAIADQPDFSGGGRRVHAGDDGVRQIADMHRADISLRPSNEGQGTVARLVFPAFRRRADLDVTRPSPPVDAPSEFF